MANRSLVVVESPAKAKTIQKYLGQGFSVMASYGHVRDLVPKEGAVDPNQNFAMQYEPIDRNLKHVDAIAKAMKGCDTLYLAPDPDREGEAIAWHIVQLLEARQLLKDKKVFRVVFHQITKNAIQEAVSHPREILMDLVNAQQARRALDFLVGFTLSPLLWKKVRAGLSAGRVQSPALRMIVERELDIEKFISQEYWSIHAKLNEESQAFSARLIEYAANKVEQFTVIKSEQSEDICAKLIKEAGGFLTVSKVTKKERKRNPAAPFITSTLQQEAARKLGFTTQRTMMVAQQLYEGIDIGEGTTGLITYMRTDSVTLAKEAIEDIRECIVKRYGKENLPSEPRVFKTKSKNAQEAHEAIRPTMILRAPDELKEYLSIEQLKLYELIWKRTIASQMVEATLHTVAIDLSCKSAVFRANGSVVVKPGFILAYQEDEDDKKSEEDHSSLLPALNEGQSVSLQEIHGEQHFTEPPPRYTEASLVKALEDHDIGRPSTYASIIATLKNRKYVDLENKRFTPTDVGRVVIRFLTQYFTQYVDYDFTAHLEEQLDDISRGEKEWVPILEQFWQPFKSLIDETGEKVKRSDVTQEPMDELCPKCQKQLSIRLGRNGRFIGCSGYPECDYTRNLTEDGDESADLELIKDRQCPKCQQGLVIRHGRYGKFIGCSQYPTCKFIEPLEKPKDTTVECPKCKNGHIVQRKSRKGKIFYSCECYPKCDYAIWNEPVAQACPSCQWPILTIKETKKNGKEIVCPQTTCQYTDAYIDKAEKE